MTLNTLALQELSICLIDVMMVVLFSFSIISAIPTCIAHDVVIINGTLLKYTISTASVTSWCHSRGSSGQLSYAFSTTFVGVFLLSFFLVILDLALGCLLHVKVCLVDWAIGQHIPSTYLMKSLILGCPMMSCIDQALHTSEYSLIVYLSLTHAIYCVNFKEVTFNVREGQPLL